MRQMEMDPIKFQVQFNSKLILFPIMSLRYKIDLSYVKGQNVHLDAYYQSNVRVQEVNSIKEDVLCVWKDQFYKLEFVDQDVEKINFGF